MFTYTPYVPIQASPCFSSCRAHYLLYVTECVVRTGFEPVRYSYIFLVHIGTQVPQPCIMYNFIFFSVYQFRHLTAKSFAATHKRSLFFRDQ